MGWLTRSARRAMMATALATSTALAGGVLAQADTFKDSFEADNAPMVLEAGSSRQAAAGIKVAQGGAAEGDVDPGCNIDPGEDPVVVDVVTPAGITASPDPLVIPVCGVNQQVKFQASSAAVSGIATVTFVSGPAGGGSYINDVNIPITVTRPAPPNTRPSVAIRGVSDGADYVVGSVPEALCAVTDAEDGPSAFPATLTGAADGALGSQTATCEHTDAGGLQAVPASATYAVVAPPNSAPAVVVGGVADGATYEIGAVPAATCAVTDAEDGDRTKPAALSGDLAHGLGSQTATCEHTDEGGLEADAARATYAVVDTGAPAITSALTPAAPGGDNGWYTSGVDVDFTCADEDGSGIKDCTGDVTLAEGKDQSARGEATDWAGNSVSDTVSGLDVDTTAPTVSLVGGPTASQPFGRNPAAPTCQATDAVSGIASCVVTGGGTTVGSHSYTATATDKAGHQATATLTYRVLPWTTKGYYFPVDMGGVWNTVKGGSTVPFTFEAFAGTTEQTSTATVKSFTQKTVPCPTGKVAVDAIELVVAGPTSLRYDRFLGVFVQTWQTPKKPGSCVQAVATLQDGSTVSANFALK